MELSFEEEFEVKIASNYDARGKDESDEKLLRRKHKS